MSEPDTKNSSQRGNAAFIVLFALVVVAIAAGVYMSQTMKTEDAGESAAAPTQEMASNESAPVGEVADNAADEATTEPASGDASASAQTPAPEFKIEEGNPVVAKIGGEEVKRSEVLAYIQQLPANMQQIPANQLFPLATVQVVNAKIIGDKAGKAKLDNDPAVKEQVQAVKDQIVRSVYIEKQVDAKLTEERLKQAYETYKQNFPELEEVKARHILVKDEALAKDLLKQIKDGADFAALAKEHSIDGTKEKGGELSYVARQEVVPEFAEAVFAMNKGEMNKTPIKTDFGYHVVEVLDKRQRPVPEYEVAKPFLEAQLRNVVLEEILGEWRKAANVEVYDINGKPFEQAAGKPAAASEGADATSETN